MNKWIKGAIVLLLAIILIFLIIKFVRHKNSIQNIDENTTDLNSQTNNSTETDKTSDSGYASYINDKIKSLLGSSESSSGSSSGGGSGGGGGGGGGSGGSGSEGSAGGEAVTIPNDNPNCPDGVLTDITLIKNVPDASNIEDIDTNFSYEFESPNNFIINYTLILRDSSQTFDFDEGNNTGSGKLLVEYIGGSSQNDQIETLFTLNTKCGKYIE